jgi:hypothetical protein
MDLHAESTIRVTGVGSMPGTDSAEAARISAGEFDVPFLPELPARGPGADMIGRTLALVAAATGEFAAETTPDGWRLAGGRSGADPGRQMRRGASWLAEDLDHLEQQLPEPPSRVKVQVAGPWTVAAALESVRGTRLVADPGACTDLSVALGEALAGHVAQVRRRMPGAEVVVQVDEPGLPAVLSGRLRTASGRGALRVPGLPEVTAGLSEPRVAAESAGAGLCVVHCCARDLPLDVVRRAGFGAVSVDLAVLGRSADEGLGAWWDRGGVVVLGTVPTVDAPRLTAPDVARDVLDMWGRIGFGMAEVGPLTVLSPGCGLAGSSPQWSRQVGALLRDTARLLESAG